MSRPPLQCRICDRPVASVDAKILPPPNAGSYHEGQSVWGFQLSQIDYQGRRTWLAADNTGYQVLRRVVDSLRYMMVSRAFLEVIAEMLTIYDQECFTNKQLIGHGERAAEALAEKSLNNILDDFPVIVMDYYDMEDTFDPNAASATDGVVPHGATKSFKYNGYVRMNIQDPFMGLTCSRPIEIRPHGKVLRQLTSR